MHFAFIIECVYLLHLCPLPPNPIRANPWLFYLLFQLSPKTFALQKYYHLCTQNRFPNNKKNTIWKAKTSPMAN